MASHKIWGRWTSARPTVNPRPATLLDPHNTPCNIDLISMLGSYSIDYHRGNQPQPALVHRGKAFGRRKRWVDLWQCLHKFLLGQQSHTQHGMPFITGRFSWRPEIRAETGALSQQKCQREFLLPFLSFSLKKKIIQKFSTFH